jgi:branched-subunit amino acid aminotransferase/4-amino-4-deoxychorismate lyase
MSPVKLRAWLWDGAGIVTHRGGVSLSDRGFRYGQHLFESIAIRNGRALLGREHLKLLADSARQKGIPLSRAMMTALRKFLLEMKLADGMLRIYLTAGDGAPASPIRMPGLYLTWEPTHFPTERELRNGIALTVLKKPFLGEDWGIKSGNYEPHLRAMATAREAGAREGIVLDDRGRVLSCTMGNLLVWLPGRTGAQLITPAARLGARSGAVLSWVRRHVRVLERDLRSPDLRRAVTMAVTNSRLGVIPVASLDGKKLSGISPAVELAQGYLRAHDLLGNA